jgi:Uncharacterised nucleotidyltransferase
MRIPQTNTDQNILSNEERMREAVLLSFCEPLPRECMRLCTLSRRSWRRLLHWLDTSGMALYFLDRMMELDLCGVLPEEVLSRLQQNLEDNTLRIERMIAESVAIQRRFQAASLSYANLKGFSLCPSSVPRPELRSQLDLDFLVAERSAPDARKILEERGYRLHAISGRSWEFKANQAYGISLKDLYKDVPLSSVELHLEADGPERTSLLARAEMQPFRGIDMPVLSAVDLFLGQGLHFYKHVCSEFSRTAHLIEFRRHVIARRADGAFWGKLRSLAEENRRAPLALGLVTLLIEDAMGTFAPNEFSSWTVDRLPDSARLWVRLYGRRSVFASFPGSKLYLLLQRELETAGVGAKRSVRQSLLPNRLPPAVVPAEADESLGKRVRRYRMQSHFIFFRLRFHVVEGLRYLGESLRWRQHMNGLAS